MTGSNPPITGTIATDQTSTPCTERLVKEGFYEGDFPCLVCGKTLHLHGNGGELDQTDHCGIHYGQRSRGYDLWAWKKTGLPL
jgi:hypothetical protein